MHRQPVEAKFWERDGLDDKSHDVSGSEINARKYPTDWRKAAADAVLAFMPAVTASNCLLPLVVIVEVAY